MKGPRMRLKKFIPPMAIALFAVGLLAGCRPAEKPAQTEPAQPVVRVHDETPMPEAPMPIPAAPGPTEKNEAKDQRIDIGFFFKDGVYVPPPYDVRVVDRGIKINDRWAQEPPGPPPKGTPIPKEDPGPFNWTPELLAKGMGRSGFIEHGVSRFLYWQAKHGYDEARKRFEVYLKEQPLVARTEVLDGPDFDIEYWTKEGYQDGFRFPRPRSQKGVPPEGRNEERKEKNLPTPSTPEERLTRHADGIRKTLADGGAFLVFGGAQSTIPGGTATERLPRIYDVLTSDSDAGEKVAALIDQGLMGSRGMAQKFVTEFKDSPTLRDRMEKLRAANKDMDGQ